MMLSRKALSNEWCFSFRRPLHAWEEDELSRLIALLGAAPSLHLEQGDSMRWNADPTGVFEVNIAYKWCELANGIASSSTGLIWNTFAPPKSKFIIWLAWKGRLKTTEFLSRIGVLRGNVDSSCVFCKRAMESLNHIPLSCLIVWTIWSNIM